MLLNNKLCADAGTPDCPCYLAECGKCIVCSRLGAASDSKGLGAPANSCGGQLGAASEKSAAPAACDCQWQGMCIYNEYLQNNQCITDKQRTCANALERTGEIVPGERQRGRLCKIQKIKWFKEDLAVMQISVPRGMAEKALLPGSFVFVKSPGADKWFEFPLSVMKSDYEKSVLELAVKIQGPKSRDLLKRCAGASSTEMELTAGVTSGRDDDVSHMDDDCKRKDEDTSPIDDDWIAGEKGFGYIELRGIYKNGLLGAEKLTADHASGNAVTAGKKSAAADNMDVVAGAQIKRVLCLAKGVGIAPAANYIRWAAGRHEIDVIVDLDKITRQFAEYALGIDDACSGNNLNSGVCPDGINSLTYGPLPVNMSWSEQEKYDVIIISASEYYQQNIYVPKEKKVLSNNHTMCCGEGICGACMCIDGNGVGRRMCKCAGLQDE